MLLRTVLSTPFGPSTLIVTIAFSRFATSFLWTPPACKERLLILKDTNRVRQVIPMPKDIYYQQGDLILKRIPEATE